MRPLIGFAALDTCRTDLLSQSTWIWFGELEHPPERLDINPHVIDVHHFGFQLISTQRPKDDMGMAPS